VSPVAVPVVIPVVGAKVPISEVTISEISVSRVAIIAISAPSVSVVISLAVNVGAASAATKDAADYRALLASNQSAEQRSGSRSAGYDADLFTGRQSAITVAISELCAGSGRCRAHNDDRQKHCAKLFKHLLSPPVLGGVLPRVCEQGNDRAVGFDWRQNP
jgi:hypothetical protein